ncbi:oligosaccharide flippase family protein [[Clostridium] innocuum]|nr:oligosaccharide flippase family protein [[Clostridium] innocuum]
MRLKNTLINSIAGILSQFILMIVSFWVRKIFIDYLGNEYLGINSVYSSLLQFLNLAELGISSAIIFNLYGPLAKGNENKITYLMLQYKRIYQKIGYIILLVGFFLMFFVDKFMEGITVDIWYLRATFFIQLLGTVSTFFFAYKRSLLLADQKNYICQIVDTIVSLVSYLIRLVVIIWLHSFVLYLIIQVIQNIASNIICSLYCDKVYPYIKNKKYSMADVEELTLKKDIKDVAIYKISSFIYTSTDSLIISKFISTIILGIYSNYKLILDFIANILSQITNSVLSSLGNFINDDKNTKEVYQLIDLYTFICFGIGTFCCVSFLCLFQPTIYFWIGNENLLSFSIVVTSCMYFFLRQIRTPIGNLYYAFGMYRFDKIGMITTAVINIVLSTTLTFYIGLNGVFIGTVFADLFYLIFSTHVIFREYFKVGYLKYLKKIFLYCVIAAFECMVCVYFVDLFMEDYSLFNYVLRVFSCIILPNLFNYFIAILFGYKDRIFEIVSTLKGVK